MKVDGDRWLKRFTLVAGGKRYVIIQFRNVLRKRALRLRTTIIWKAIREMGEKCFQFNSHTATYCLVWLRTRSSSNSPGIKVLYWSNEAIFDAGRAREFVNELSILFRFNSVRFTKNLSPNKISVKFLKGEGELHNLELDETTLAELLELPPWIRLTKATCNRISAKVKSFSLALVVTFFLKFTII